MTRLNKAQKQAIAWQVFMQGGTWEGSDTWDSIVYYSPIELSEDGINEIQDIVIDIRNALYEKTRARWDRAFATR